MSEEKSFPRVQYSMFVTGDQAVFRADSGEEFKEVVEGYAENADDIVKAVNSIKQVSVANGIITGDSQNKGAAPRERKSDSAPPSSGVPQCSHGAMKDLGDKGYKHRWYCPAPRGQKQCSARD